jgi:hypothetical protein
MSDTEEVKPDFVTDEHLEYLDDLRDSGVTNMYGAPAYLKRAFRKLTEQQAREATQYWMHTFSKRHPK